MIFNLFLILTIYLDNYTLGWIRTAKDSHIIMNDIYSLNKTGIRVGAYDGTAYATFVQTELTAATYVKFTAVNLQYQSVLDQSVHALIGDAIQFFSWANGLNGTCNCTVRAWDTAYGLSTFTTINITATSYGVNVFGGYSYLLAVLLISLTMLFHIVMF